MKLYSVVLASLYSSSGIGQIASVPGILITSVASAYYGVREGIAHAKWKKSNLHDHETKKITYKNKAIDFASYTAFFALGGVPVIGGPLGLYAKKGIKKKKPPFTIGI